MTPTFLRRRMHRFAMILAMVLILLKPSPALAWFGWLDEWSGPGPFWGELYQVRVFCWGPKVPSDSVLLEQAARAFEAAEHLQAQASTNPSGLDAELKRIIDVWDALYMTLGASLEAVGANPVNVSPFKSVTIGEGLNPGLSKALETAHLEVDRTINEIRRRKASLAGVGVLASLCGPEKVRRFSLEIELDHWVTRQVTPRFANEKPITMYTVMPSVSWNPLVGQPLDVVDIGIGAGFYTFRSQGFDAFSGFIVQPRLDLHAPTSWSNHKLNHPQRIISLFTLRSSLMWTPAGFKANAFAGPGQTTEKIEGEAKPSFSIFINLSSLLTRTVTLNASGQPGAAKP